MKYIVRIVHYIKIHVDQQCMRITSYHGHEGDTNTLCILDSSLSSGVVLIPDGLSCNDNNDCGIFSTCNTNLCMRLSKDCLRMCSGHGTCV